MYSPGKVLDPNAPDRYAALLKNLRGVTMPRIIKEGRGVAPSGPPPAGIQARCSSCGTELETTNNEPDAVATVFNDQDITFTPGWEILCPCCRKRKVFFRAPGF